MTSNHHAPYDLGYTRTTMAIKQREAKQRCGANPEKLSQFRLQAETRLHEVGIASNRRSACCGEYVAVWYHGAVFALLWREESGRTAGTESGAGGGI